MTRISGDISKAAALLQNDEIVAIPTETVYGLAGNIFSEKAIKKIFELKKRPLYNPLIVHTYDFAQLGNIAIDIPSVARKLASTFWPGSLTLILKKQAHIPDLITAGKDTVGVRIPNHPITLQLLSQLDFPIAAPSANPFTHISSTTPEHVDGYFSDDLKMILDGGNCERGIESTIIGFPDGVPMIYRFGAISLEAIEEVVGPVKFPVKNDKSPIAPGMLSRHYAPRTPTFLVKNIEAFISTKMDKKIAVLTFLESISHKNVIHQTQLSTTGNLEEAAATLYAALHQLDSVGADMIVAERLPDAGLGKSINDRLERATR